MRFRYALYARYPLCVSEAPYHMHMTNRSVYILRRILREVSRFDFQCLIYHADVCNRKQYLHENLVPRWQSRQN